MRIQSASGPLSPRSAKSAVALLLTFTAGFVDIAGYIALFQTFTAHMTGNTVHLGHEMAQRHWSTVAFTIAIIGSFVIGSIVGRALIEVAARKQIRQAASITLALEAGLIATVAFAAPAHDPLLARGLLVVLAAAMGLQTATLTRVGPLTVHTTFVTGMLNKLAQLLAHTLFLTYDIAVDGAPEQWARKQTLRQARFIFSIWLLYLAGAATGALATLAYNLRALLVPLLILIIAIAVDQFWPLSLQEEKDELEPR